MVTSLAVYAPVVVIGTAARRAELSALIDARAANCMMRDGGCLPAAPGLIRSRLRQVQRVADSTHETFAEDTENSECAEKKEAEEKSKGILKGRESGRFLFVSMIVASR